MSLSIVRTLAPLSALAALSLLSVDANAAGIGFTHQQGMQYETRGWQNYSGLHQLPTLDIRTDGVVIQIDALETIAAITNKETDANGDEKNSVHLGVGVYATVAKKPVKGDKDGGDIVGVMQPGGQLTIDTNTGFDPSHFALLGGLRMGAQASKGMGFGMYVIPQLGVASAPDLKDDPSKNTIGLAVGGQFQVSVWIK